MYRSDLKRREAYTAYSNPRGFIYQNKDKKNMLMRIDELHKFSDRTLNDVRHALDDPWKGSLVEDCMRETSGCCKGPYDSSYAAPIFIETVREFHVCTREKGQLVSSYVLKMKGYIDNLERLGQPVGQNLAVSLILVSLSKDYDSFVQNYNMHDIGKAVNELHAMLKFHEDTLPKKYANPALHAIQAGRVKKNRKINRIKLLRGVMMTTSVGNNSVFKSFFKKQKLTGPNFIDWYRQLRLVLSTEDKENYLGHHIPAVPVAPPGQQVPPHAIAAHELKAMYSKQAEQELLQTVREFHTCKREEVSLILVSLNKDFDSFVRNYNIHGMGKTVNELHAMLKLHEESLPKKDDNPALHAIRAGRVQKKQKNKSHKAGKGSHGKGKGKMRNASNNASFAFKPKTPPPTKKDNPAKDAICHQCALQGLRGSKKLKPGALSLYVGDGHRAAVEAIGTYHLELLSGLVIVLNNCHYASSITGERRNQTLLDMVRSMMSQTTLPKSFWDYALETVARILNMVPTKKNAEFFESKLLDLKGSGSVKDLELIQEEDTNPSVDTGLNHEEDNQEIDEPQSDINPIRKSSRTRRAPDPALLDPESKKLLDAMNVKMQSMKDNDVWVLVELPPNARTIRSKWLFKKKTNMDGAMYIFKARLVAKGFTQTYEVDYEETFSPVTDIRAIRILIAIAAYYDYEIWQMDVKTAFLNGYLFEEVYMEQPKRFDDEIKKFDFTQNPDEPYVYIKASGSYIAILILYVDDILLMGNNIPMLKDVKSYLGRSFVMKDLGEAAYILGIKIYRDRSKRLIGLCQKAYIEKILKRFYIENSKCGTIPMQEKLKLSKSQGASTPAEKKCMQNIPYASAVGSIMYAVRYAEYIAAFDASKEAVWIHKFISGLGIVPTIEEPISMYCDNTGAIAIAKDDGVTKVARHFRAKVYYLRETIKLGDVKIEKIDTYDNLVDPFTKALAFSKHSELTRNIGLLPASSFM
nr:hypothetical protein [Tanacetum cinerariifolium]